MAIRTEKLGGTDWVDGNVLTAEDLVDTIDVNTKVNLINKFVIDEANDVQIFTESGTWTKPITGSLVYVRVWGAGGSGGKYSSNSSLDYATGGGGGAYSEKWFNIEDLGVTENVTVGIGGAGVITQTSGNTGGTSSFGSHLTSTGGGGGRFWTSNASTPTASGGRAGLSHGILQTGVVAPRFDDSFANTWADHIYGGAGGSGTNKGGNSLYGGAGGGIGRGGTSVTAGGISVYGGNGGAGGRNGVDAGNGEYPAGGGGGTAGGIISGAGANGKVEVYTF